jgi:hypothetical protein
METSRLACPQSNYRQYPKEASDLLPYGFIAFMRRYILARLQQCLGQHCMVLSRVGLVEFMQHGHDIFPRL